MYHLQIVCCSFIKDSELEYAYLTDLVFSVDSSHVSERDRNVTYEVVVVATEIAGIIVVIVTAA